MTPEEHKARHQLLHRNFDELVADWIGHTKELPSRSSIADLMRWSFEQTIKPDEPEEL